ncbi:50S ribosomal protein L35 [Thermoleophilum album]|uniref:Large ribosomal subunit protein bL35 n=1 Tax=Thermoleophilum album TaxID=29539 RepID=A0A1H6FW63_THEAL|nr:50S ribosomal protein L35 [Thermoleophilum album]SEH15031.1 large subunit ribosomal protein L35 [Thermoleophilum album]
MPKVKIKTHSGAKKRFRKTGSGKLVGRHAMTSHNLGKKRPRRKRRLAKALVVSPQDRRTVKRLLGI